MVAIIKNREIFKAFGGFLLCVTAITLSHWPLLNLPFFWDEAGYYVHAAWDLYSAGSLIPTSVVPEAHPPLIPIYVAIAGEIIGFTPTVARSAMVLWSAMALLGAYFFARRLTSPVGATAATVLLGAYPIFFVQATLVQLDMPVTTLSIWASWAVLKDRFSLAYFLLACAALTKGTGFLTGVGLAIFVVIADPLSRALLAKARNLAFIPVLCFGVWLIVHWYLSGSIFGGSNFVEYNLLSLITSPKRLATAAVLRLWHLTGHVGLWGLVLPSVAVGWVNRKKTWMKEAPLGRAALLVTCVGGIYLIAFTFIGGAVLARYMLPVTALLIIFLASAASSLLSRKFSGLVFLLALGTFTMGLFSQPSYHTAFEDTLMYADFVRLHQQAVAMAQQQYTGQTFVTSWPATDELTKPYLGYVNEPLPIKQITDFSSSAVDSALANCHGECVVLAFDTQYEPSDSWMRPSRLLSFWKKAAGTIATRPGTTPEIIAHQNQLHLESALRMSPHFVAFFKKQ